MSKVELFLDFIEFGYRNPSTYHFGGTLGEILSARAMFLRWEFSSGRLHGLFEGIGCLGPIGFSS